MDVFDEIIRLENAMQYVIITINNVLGIIIGTYAINVLWVFISIQVESHTK